MNRIKNDLGEWVISVGAEGSEARISAQYPRLISELSVIYHYSPCEAIIIEEVTQNHGFSSPDAKVIASIVSNRETPYQP